MRTKKQEMNEMDQNVKEIVRYISKGMPQPGVSVSIEEADEYVGSWVARGYRLVNTHYMGAASENAFGIYYILVKDATG